MRYGESQHEARAFEDDEVEDSTDAGRVTMTEKTIPHFPRRRANNSNIQGVGFAIKIPNSMSGVEFTTAPSVRYLPSTMHDSTPKRFGLPDTSPSKTQTVKSISHDSISVLRPKPIDMNFGKKKKI